MFSLNTAIRLIEKYFGRIEYFGVFLISVAYVFLHAFFLLHGFEYLFLAPIGMAVLYLALFHQDKLLLYLAFLVPFSVPLTYFSGKLPLNLSIPSEPILILLMILLYIRVLIEKGFDKSILLHPISLAIFFYLSWMLMTSITSEMPVVSFKFLIAKIWFISIFYFLATQLFVRYKNMIRYGMYYTVGLAVVAFYAFSQLAVKGITSQHVASKVVRPFFNDHTDYAAALAMILVFIVGVFFIRRKASGFLKTFYLGIAFLIAGALIFSYTRAAWLSVLIALGFYFGFRLKIRLRLMLIILASLIALFFTFKTDILIALERNKQDSHKDFSRHISSITNISTDASNRERLNRWACAIRMFKERPLFGWGPGTYQFQYAPFQKRSEMTIISTRRGDVGNAHSEYLGPLAEQGILGTVGFLLIIVTTLATASRLYFRAKRRKVRLLALTLMLSLMTYYVHGIMNNFLDGDKLSALFWGFTAMIAALDVYHTPSLRKK
ncbi:MAG: O-antigen ligase family protein [Bacteroidales bacterium]|nr:O-antigen ligase family protein [Bacteroidales bacterium]